MQLCDALTNSRVDNLGHVSDPLVKYIENATRLIDSQAEKIESLNSLVAKQNDEFSHSKFLSGSFNV